MKTLRFHRELYRGESVDEAVKIFARFATFQLTEEATHWVVTLTARNADRERQIAGELANYALGLTVRARSAR